ncbi:AfsR/SARP family transcriptional regulator [Streptomyces sp. 110]|uniref:AfsR/SARP family transcriptional regulator n=1 Tax=Streptomyces endocoffeicus TaxID=2898945 RepID=A0ABS1PRC3_9ACTN|nr:AfsR/SARP family transcriptional regulator [Streptomyces endocoffeicus]MBL1114978.1 AfsR/SARP family transcriptional regulator [Streptomyces endocoffeicus]
MGRPRRRGQRPRRERRPRWQRSRFTIRARATLINTEGGTALKFQVLGELNVTQDGEQVPLGGFIKRGLMSLLLLYSNRVVSTSHLLDALWPSGTPATARKMLQNAVSDVRRLMNNGRTGADEPIVLTHPPGYLLRVPAKDVDLSCFQQLAAAGRTALAKGAHEPAQKALRAALRLAKGPILSELVEEGVNWPEIEALENFVLNVREDCFEAELALGRHRAVLEEMENLHLGHPSRERLSAQLMVGLYRCGRQLDALTLYQRIRALLNDDFGLEPGEELKSLQTAIITQDPKLSLLPVMSQAAQQTSPRDLLLPPSTNGTAIGAEGRRPSAPQRVLTAARKPEPVSVVMVRTEVRCLDGEPTPEESADVAQAASATIHREFEKGNGEICLSVGEVSFSFFRNSDRSGSHVQRAMDVATSIHEHFSPASLVDDTGRRYTVRSCIVVTTGEAVLDYRAANEKELRMTVSGAVMDRCRQLLRFASAGEIRVCRATHQATASDYAVAHEPDNGWRVLVPRLADDGARAGRELDEAG